MTLQTQLLLPEKLASDDSPDSLTAVDRDALRSVSEWVRNFVACPHSDLGREGSVCPFVPGSLERRAVTLTTKHVANLDSSAVAELMDQYRRKLLEMAPPGSDDAVYTTIIVVFPDLPAERAGELFGDVLERVAVRSYEEDGILFGPFYDGNESTAIYNPGFRPFQSPVPFLFVRHTVVSDWKFFMDNDTLLRLWAERFGPAGALDLAEQLRDLPWRGTP